jgi:4-amino-4-deoxy-L-arabinose transferase-like glycosyltransferase
MFSRRWWPLWLWAAAVLAVLLINWFAARIIAVILLLFFLPGWACLEAWSPSPRQGVWRIIVAASLSLIFTSLGTLYLAYLPGPLTGRHMLLLCTVMALPALVISLRRRFPALNWPERRVWLTLVLVFVIAAVIRLVHLGYAEFHEDEVEVTSLAVRTIEGEDYAVFLHRKGPLQMLVPLAGWLLDGRIAEGWARLPFALASLLGVATVSLLALEMAGWPGGLAAGLLIALNGYLIAFGRMVQYQALIFFLASLAVACLWRVLKEGEATMLWPAMLGMAASLLAHYDAVVYLPVIAYLSWRIWQRWPAVRWRLLAAVLVAVAVWLSFYVPYVRDPQFEHTRAYLVEGRIGTSWLYNNLKTLKGLDADYSSCFYLPILWLLSLVAWVRYRPSGRVWWGVLGGALVAAWTTMRWPDFWQVNSLDLSLIPWLVLLVGGLIGLRHHQPGFEAIGLWWGAPLLAYVFLVADPRTHLYVAYPGWAMVVGLGADSAWQKAGRARPLLAAIGGVLALLVAGYQALIFLPTESAFLNLRTAWDTTFGWRVYGELPEPRSYFGYPRRVGWKAAGWLVATGQMPGDYRSVGEDFSVPIWYTFETPRSCYDDPELYLVAQPLEGLDDSLRGRLTVQYVHTATVYSEDYPRIALFVKQGPGSIPEEYKLEDIVSRFDQAATPDRFAGGGRPSQPVEAQFGEVARLYGFTLANQQVTPGEILLVYLYWQSTSETEVAYRAFVHLGENPVWGQHDDDPACRLPTTLWRAGQTAIGQFRIMPSPETPPGDYPLVLGLYHPTSGERLPIMDADGQSIGDSLVLATVRVVAW